LEGNRTPLKKPRKINALQGAKSAPKTPQKRDFRLPANLPAGIVPDKQWPGMMPPS